ncbi:hypothetical protein ROHU_000760 [Labeo rohita]|uniref:Uncharacterized protein n=1 Tax=Labeo rohita TaxID=84645 RepID=A0A498NBC5_LABRO|nr:hypothetical protein ROHU_017730 [Labeo rohita]RXN38830.1 hypothetical protein ROHU_000760 [Labeo rohita]
MSYLKRWRKIRSEAAAIALECSSEDDSHENLDDPNQCEVNGGENLAAEENSTSRESDELGDTDSDFGYKEYVSTDSEEVVESAKEEEITFQEKLASWATRNDNCDTDPQSEEEDDLRNVQPPNTNEEPELPVAPRKEPISKNQTRQHSDGELFSQEIRQSGSSLVQQSSSSKQQRKHSPYPMQEAKFQRKVMEMLVEMREDIRTLKRTSGGAETHTISSVPVQASSIEELGILDESLKCLEEKQRLINSLSSVGGIHLKDNVKRVMEKECPENNKRDGGKYCSGHRLMFKICPRQDEKNLSEYTQIIYRLQI